MSTPGKGTPIMPRTPAQKKPPASPATSPLVISDADKRARRQANITEALETVGVVLGFTASLTGSQPMQLDAMAVGLHAETVAPGLAEFAERNRFVAMLVDRADAVTGVAGLLTAALPLVYQVVVNHAPKTRRLPDGKEVPNELPPQLIEMGVFPPEMLLERYRANVALKVARAQAKILRDTQAAQEEVAHLRGNGDTPA